MSAHAAQLGQAHALVEQDRLEQARTLMVRVLAKSPADTDAQMLMSFICAKLKDFDKAAYYAHRVAQRLPDDPRAWANLCNALTDAGRPEQAAAAVGPAAERLMADEALAITFSTTLMRTKRPDLALDYCARAMRHAPRAIGIIANAAAAAASCGYPDRAVDLWRQAAAIEPDSERILNGLLTAINYAELREHGREQEHPSQYGQLLERLGGRPLQPWNLSPDPDRRLRVGLLSPDFRNHAMSYFIEPVLRHHNRQQWELFCYSTASQEDQRTESLRSMVGAGCWRRLSGMRYVDAAGTIRNDQIDVLIDMAGHTAGHALGAMHLRPAPVQMTWLGYPGSTGVAAVDYRVVDSISDPPPPAPWRCTERPLRLDPCLAVWTPPDASVPLSAPPRTTNEFFTFGSFSAIQKLTDTTVRLWTAVLNAVPGSRLLYKTTGLAGPPEGVQRLVRERFARAGADNTRIDLEGPGSGAAEMLRQYARVDISLDTFPYQGTTTVCESLWMGVPMVCLEGPAGVSPSRVACSLLASVGEASRIARDERGYAATAAALADPGTLTALRSNEVSGLRNRMAASALMDGPALGQRLANEVRRCWHHWCNNHAR